MEYNNIMDHKRMPHKEKKNTSTRLLVFSMDSSIGTHQLYDDLIKTKIIFFFICGFLQVLSFFTRTKMTIFC